MQYKYVLVTLTAHIFQNMTQNPSDRTTILGSTQPLIEMSTRIIS